MNTCINLFLWLLAASTISWIYLVPSPVKLMAKVKAYKTFVKEPFTVDVGPNVTVTLSLGKIIGTTIKPNLVDYYKDKNGGDIRTVHQFLGVPFASPPVKELRFKKPKPVQKWSPKTIEAIDWKADCLQPNEYEGIDPVIMEAFGFAHSYFAEDCLYLNIWTPSLPQTSADKLKPVLVWIYGGGYTNGGSTMVTNHGYTLASSEDIVVVSFNYRLGALGFAVTADANLAPGNAGLWDQVMALEWVQDHIKYFGGDPNQVTIAGVSAGAFSTSALMASPVTRNLFQNVVEMSGSSLVPTIFLDRNIEIPKNKHLASIINCSTDNDQAMFDCMVKTEAKNLLITDLKTIKTFPGKESFGMGSMMFAPTTGDDLLPDKTHRLLQTEDVKKKLKQTRVLFGLTNWEGGLMKFLNEKSIIVNNVKSTFKDSIVTKIDWLKGMTNYLVDYHGLSEKEAETISSYYLKDTFSLTDQKVIDEKSLIALYDLIGDILLTCPPILEADITSKNVKSMHSYVISFKSQKNELLNMICPEDELLCHGLDTGYWLGSVLLKSNSLFNDEQDFNQAIDALNILGRFVRNEKLTVNGSEWKSYESKSKLSLELNVKKNNPYVNDFRNDYCNLIKKLILK